MYLYVSTGCGGGIVVFAYVGLFINNSVVLFLNLLPFLLCSGCFLMCMLSRGCYLQKSFLTDFLLLLQFMFFFSVVFVLVPLTVCVWLYVRKLTIFC